MGMSYEKYVDIKEKDYLALLEDQRFLRALEAAGVDNWEGYGIAQDYLEK